MRSMLWQLEILGTILALSFRHRETNKDLCRGGRSQDLPNTDFQAAARHLKKKQQYTHSKTNTHKITTIHTRQLQQYTRPNENNYKQDNLKLATKHTRQNGKIFPGRTGSRRSVFTACSGRHRPTYSILHIAVPYLKNVSTYIRCEIFSI